MIIHEEALKDKGIFFFDNKEIPKYIEISDKEIKVVGSNREIIIPKDSLRGKAILNRIGIGKESELSQEIYL